MTPRDLVLITAFALNVSTQGFAQSERREARQQPPAVGVVEFEPEPHRIPSLGLKIHVPLGSIVESTRVGERATTRITPEPVGLDGVAWIIDIQPVDEPSQTTTIAELADRITQRLIEVGGAPSGQAPRPESAPRVLLREKQLRLPGGSAERFYISFPQGQYVRGTTIFQISSTRFAAFSLFAQESAFADARLIYEALVSSATFEDAQAADIARAAAVKLGLGVLHQLTESDYTTILSRNSERWERFHIPAPTGADADSEELGYRRISAWEGRRGEVNVGLPRSRWSAADEQRGYLVRIESRLIERQRTDTQRVINTVIYDTVATYFMTPDGSEESWLIRLARRDGGQVSEWEELGARTDTSMNVKTSGVAKTPTVVKPIFESEGYISQVQAFLLPQLLVKAGIVGDFAFYTYRSADNKVVLRRDTLERPASNPELWLLRSKATEDAPEQQWLFAEDGSLIRSVLQDGRVWEPITLDRLANLWRSKGLPMK